jgi:hypothetical protein
VYAVVSDIVLGMAVKPPLPCSRMEKPEVTEIRPGYYHGGGLLSVNHLGGEFRVRSVFSPSRWCKRPLTPGELAVAFDIPHQVVNQCADVNLRDLCMHPGKALEYCARSLLAHGGVIGRGEGSLGLVKR